MLLDVLTRFCADSGLHITQKRVMAIQILNQSAKEMHRELECSKLLREVTLAVQPDQVVALPSFIGELRGLRMHTNELPFDVNSIGSPRFTSNTLAFKFKNWRDLGEGATASLPANVGHLTLTTNQVETTPVVVKICGQTDKSIQTEESVTISAVSNITASLFGPQIYTISCSTLPRTSDITILDDAGNVLAVLYNNALKTRYKIVDVSQVFWTLDTAAGESLIDVLYKVPATNLVNDSDSFYAGDDYDDAWYNMAMFMFLKPLQNRLQDATTHRQVCMDFIQSAKESGESGIVKKITFGRNRFYGLFKKYRYFPGSVTNVDHNIQG